MASIKSTAVLLATTVRLSCRSFLNWRLKRATLRRLQSLIAYDRRRA